MNARELLRRHAVFFAILTVTELAIGWAIARAIVASLRRHLVLHPDGLRALFRDGGRGTVDLVLSAPPERTFARPVFAVLVGVLVYFLATRVLETFVASTLATGRRSLRALPRIVVVHLVTLVGFAAVAFAAWLGFTGARDTVSNWYDRRAADLVILASTVPALLVALILQAIDDLATIRSAGGRDLLTAISDALLRIREAPGRLVVGRVAVVFASVALFLVGAAFSWSAERSSVAITIACVVAQQSFAAGRIALRIAWLAHLAAPWRTRENDACLDDSRSIG